ncbi:hypothetical protein HANVADRAFT_3879 [Hanseniaspora valbyensis NRRL Y-1626]|uniref:Coatomer subunit epsilon n=1 Tax=Hanseniaspora valbyensis NRRL Y-1626 TaxID=766949 RepID=A0A1B7T9C1_9ASCO|nr:hypothetical protein HANVADRAFT_3879 [Hanseniaspora valbyensis NRRL Y-1626]
MSSNIYNIKKNYYIGSYQSNIELPEGENLYYKALSIIDNYINNGSTNNESLTFEYEQLIVKNDDDKLSVLLFKYVSVLDNKAGEGVLDDIDLRTDIMTIEDSELLNYSLAVYFKIMIKTETSLEEVFKQLSFVYKTLIKDLLSSETDTLYPYMEVTFLLGSITAYLQNWEYLQGLVEFLNGKVDISSEDEIMLSFLEFINALSTMNAESKDSSFYFVEDLIFNNSGNNNNIFIDLLMINLHLANKNYDEVEQLINKINSQEGVSKDGAFYEYFLIANINYRLQLNDSNKEIIDSLREELANVCELNGTNEKNPYLVKHNELSAKFDEITTIYL